MKFSVVLGVFLISGSIAQAQVVSKEEWKIHKEANREEYTHVFASQPINNVEVVTTETAGKKAVPAKLAVPANSAQPVLTKQELLDQQYHKQSISEQQYNPGHF